MELTGQAVKHAVFGKGIVTGQASHTITVAFPEGEKRFLYPEAFEQYLTLKSERAEADMEQLLEARKAKRTAETQAMLEEQEQLQRVQNFKITANSQAAFALELEQGDVFRDWAVDTGRYLSGGAKGEPRVPDRLKPNSVCLLTRRPESGVEEEREIVGMFMVPEDFFGEDCTDGRIPAHPAHRLVLSRPMPFWNYFQELKRKPRWGKTTFKYFGNGIMQRILFDCMEHSAGKEEEQVAQEFYQYFNRVNRMMPLHQL